MQIKRIVYLNMFGDQPACVGTWDRDHGFRTASGQPCTERYLHELSHGQTMPVAQYAKPDPKFRMLEKMRMFAI